MAIIPTDLLDRIRGLERQVRALMGSANTSPAMNQISNGDVVIGEKGRLRVRTAHDADLFYLGQVEPDRDEETPQQGLLIRRDDGSLALTLRTAAPDILPVQSLQILDSKSNVVVSDDAVAAGLARPYIPYPLPSPAATAGWESTGSVEWTTLYQGPGIAQHPRLYCRIAATGSDNAEVRLLANGTPVGPPGGSTGLEFTEPLGLEYGTTVSFEVQARVATAGDTIRCVPLALYGIQS